jgi:hypothetical protein
MGEGDVARFQDEELRAVPDDVRDRENHIRGCAVLKPLSIDVEVQGGILHILDFILCDDPVAFGGISLATIAPARPPAATAPT